MFHFPNQSIQDNLLEFFMKIKNILTLPFKERGPRSVNNAEEEEKKCNEYQNISYRLLRC